MNRSAKTTADKKDILDQRLMQTIFMGLCLIVVLVAIHMSKERELSNTEPLDVLQERTVHLSSSPRQGTVIRDAQSQVIARFEPGDGGIFEVLGAVLERQRLRQKAAHDAPIVVRLHEGRHVSLLDPVTGHSYKMASYGRDNIEHIIEHLIE